MVSFRLIEGAKFADNRGNLSFFNAFDMNDVVRFYEIAPNDTVTVRAWQGHKKEKKWFYCNSGAFTINLIELHNFESPSPNIQPERIVLNAKKPTVLEISGGYANGFKAMEEGSKLLVFSNFSLEESKADDYRYPVDKWTFRT